MNSQKTFILSAFFLTTILLAGCQDNGVQSATKPAQNTPSKSNTQQPAVSAPIPGMPDFSQNNVTYSATDTAAFSSAQQLKDPTFCDKISDAAYKEECKQTIANDTVLNEAVSKMDATLCDKLPTADAQGVCKINVEAAVKTNQEDLAQKQATQDEVTKSDQIVKSKDLSQCKNLEQSFVMSCELNILLNEALDQKKPELCDQATDPKTVEQCKTQYQQLNE